MERIRDGEWHGLTASQYDALRSEFDAECEVLDLLQPTLEAWLAAKLHDLRKSEPQTLASATGRPS